MRRLCHLRALCLLLAAFITPAAWGADSRVSFPGNSRFTVLRLADQHGLGAVTVTALAQDKDGFLWIGTQTGLYRFDGVRAQKIAEVEAIVGHYIVDMLIAPDGTPWFAGNHGIAHLRNGVFEKLPIPASAMPLAAGNQIFAVDSRGVVYMLLFNRGILRLNPDNPAGFRIFDEADGLSDAVGGIVRGPDDAIWFTSSGRLGSIKPSADGVHFDPAIHISKERVVALVFDGSKSLWVRTATQLARLDMQSHKLIPERHPIPPANQEEGKPTLDQHGRLLVPSSAGLYWQRDDSWQRISERQGVSSDDIQAGLEDREGTLWVAGSGTGLDYLPGVHEWSSWTTAEGLPSNSTWSTLRDHQGRLWVSTGGGIAIWDPRTQHWMRISSLGEHAHREVRQLELGSDGSVWALTPGGAVVRIDANTFATSFFSMYRGRPFITVFAGPDGKIWATTRARLVRFDSRQVSGEPENVPLPEMENSGVEFLSFAPGGTLWASSPGGLLRFDGRNWRVLTTSQGLQGQMISSVVAISDHEVWVGYNDVVGVTRVTLDEHGIPHFEYHPWDWTILYHDSKNRVWFDGTDGLAILHPDGHILRRGHPDGLVWDDVSPWTGVREESDGSYVIATSRGLARYSPNLADQARASSSVILTSLSLGGVVRDPRERPVVHPDSGTFAVQFSPLVLGNPSHVSCRYQLKGLEDRATDTQMRELRYASLPAGDYEFWVQCQSDDSSHPTEAASFHFQVLPDIWKTGWAKFAALLLGLLGLWLFTTWRIRRESRRREELEQAVAQRNAELLQKNKELEDISLTDPLTGTRNRRYFYETITTDIAQALRSHLKTLDPRSTPTPRQELIFILVDIDRFKRVNDELGHSAGDRLLQEVAKRISSVMRRSDDLVRWGGEEFLLVCRTTDRESASILCTRVLEAIRELPFDVGNDVQVHKTCSIGWAPFPWLRDDVGLLSIDNVIELADKALYLAKREGRNRSFGMLPTPNALQSERPVSIQTLRDCPPDLVQIV